MKNIFIIALLILTGHKTTAQTVKFNHSQIWGKYSQSEAIKCDTSINIDKSNYSVTATNKTGKTKTIYMKSKDGKTEIKLTNKKITSFTRYTEGGGITYFKNGK